ncbi:MAG: TRAP transporter small permease [Gemmatimonadales bacterium]|jgi:TRAP-type C4-dicarboxylate transport system permease small subunit
MSGFWRAVASRIERLAAHAERALAWLLMLLMAAMVADVTWQVVSRFLLRAPSSVTEELAGFLLVWIGLLGAAYALRTRAHLGIDLLTARLDGAVGRAVAVLGHALVSLFAFLVMVVGGLRLVQLAFQLEQISAVVGFRMGYVYLVVPAAGLLMVLFSAESISAVLTGEARR